MRLHLLRDPSFARSFWCRQYERGIWLEASQASVELVEGFPAPGQPDSIVCLIGTSLPWIYQKKSELAARGAKVILLTPSGSEDPSGFSHVSFDYRAMMWRLLSYFREHGKTRTALFGDNPSSSTDALKVAAYRQLVEEPRVYENLGRLEASCAAFAADRGAFDSVICCSDLIAVELGRSLRSSGIRCPEELWMAGFGDTSLAAKVSPSITTISYDYVSIGRQAVKVASMLSRNRAFSTISLTVQGTLVPRESTGWLPPAGETPPPFREIPDETEVDFYSDETVEDLLAAENLLAHCEAVDFKILRGLGLGSRYADLADQCCLSENAIKYRIKRLQNLAGRSCRRDLLDLAGRYLDLTRLD